MFRKILRILIITGIFAAGFAPAASAAPTYFHFEFELATIVEDPSMYDTLGCCETWYQWIYEVKAVATAGDTNQQGLSHFTVGLENCYTEELLAAIEGTAGANGVPPNSGNLAGSTGNEYRTYNIETGTDNSTGIYGIKWEIVSGDFEAGDVDYFWFSAPTDQIVLNDSVVKHGQNETHISLQTPDCPDCQPVIPEPATMMLFGSAFAGMLLRKKTRNSQ